MVNHSLEQGMIAGTRDANAFTLMGSSSNKGLFALVAQKGLTTQGSQGQAFRRGPDRRRPVQLLRRPARHVRPRRSRRAVDPGRHRRERTRRGAPDQPGRCDAADGAELLPSRRGRLPGARQSRRSPVGLPVHGLPLRAQGDDRQSEARRIDHQGARRGHQALLRRQGVRREGVHRVRQAAGGRRVAHLRPVQEGQHLRARART